MTCYGRFSGMLLRLILIGLVAAAGVEPPSQADIDRTWEQGKAYCMQWVKVVDDGMPDGRDAFLKDTVTAPEKTELAQQKPLPVQGLVQGEVSEPSESNTLPIASENNLKSETRRPEWVDQICDLHELANAMFSTGFASVSGSIAEIRERTTAYLVDLQAQPAVPPVQPLCGNFSRGTTIVEIELGDFEDATIPPGPAEELVGPAPSVPSEQATAAPTEHLAAADSLGEDQAWNPWEEPVPDRDLSAQVVPQKGLAAEEATQIEVVPKVRLAAAPQADGPGSRSLGRGTASRCRWRSSDHPLNPVSLGSCERAIAIVSYLHSPVRIRQSGPWGGLTRVSPERQRPASGFSFLRTAWMCQSLPIFMSSLRRPSDSPAFRPPGGPRRDWEKFFRIEP